jgi:hypothetical protein
MPDRLLARLRGLLQFTILWLMAVTLVEALRGAVVELGGLLVVLVASAVVTFCKWRAQRGLPMPENRLAYYFWTYLPSVPALVSAGGIIYKLVRRGEQTTAGGFWGVALNLLPTALEFGVPIVALCVAYLMLVRGVVPAVVAAAPAPAPAPAPEPPAPAAMPSEAHHEP